MSTRVSSRRDLVAPRRAWEVATPKKRTLGLTPSIFFGVEPHKTEKRCAKSRASNCLGLAALHVISLL